eukprot:1282502-Rhodomonas_salina.2
MTASASMQTIAKSEEPPCLRLCTISVQVTVPQTDEDARVVFSATKTALRLAFSSASEHRLMCCLRRVTRIVSTHITVSDVAIPLHKLMCTKYNLFVTHIIDGIAFLCRFQAHATTAKGV